MKGEILMENEKKPSRLGVRLSAIMVAVFLVVCMAVPAFAASIDMPAYPPYPAVDVDTPDGYDFYFVAPGSLPDLTKIFYIFAFKAVPTVDQFNIEKKNTGWLMHNYVNDSYYCVVDATGITQDWTMQFSSALPVVGGWFAETAYGNFTVYDSTGNDVVYSPPPPPPPDLKESVSSGLTVVLDWVGATVSALFSGELAGLLPLVAIPVAITILIVAIVVIKRSIWGA